MVLETTVFLQILYCQENLFERNCQSRSFMPIFASIAKIEPTVPHNELTPTVVYPARTYGCEIFSQTYNYYLPLSGWNTLQDTCGNVGVTSNFTGLPHYCCNLWIGKINWVSAIPPVTLDAPLSSFMWMGFPTWCVGTKSVGSLPNTA